jgi:hypothetical protein
LPYRNAYSKVGLIVNLKEVIHGDFLTFELYNPSPNHLRVMEGNVLTQVAFLAGSDSKLK